MAETIPIRLNRYKPRRQRPLIAFFDYPDVFEDFYPHYGVSQHGFATRWANTGNHAFLTLLQREIGDVRWYVFSLTPELDEARHEVVGCSMKFLRSSCWHRLLWRSFYLPRAAWRWRWAYPGYATVASYTALWSWAFMQTLRRDQPDFFFVQDYASGRYDVLLALARALRVPTISYHTGSSPEQYIGRWAKRWTIPWCSHLIASSDNERQRLVRRYGVSPARVSVILTPIDTDVYRPCDRAHACRGTALDPSRRYLLFVGRLDDRIKRISSILRAFSTIRDRHQDVDVLIAGGGRDELSLRALAARLAPGRVHFMGWVASAHTKAQLYSLAEYLLLPSRSEGFATVIGEAMACGLPVIASNVGGSSELVIEGRTGWLVPPEDEAALQRVLSSALSVGDAAGAMRVQARELAEARVSPGAVSRELQQCFARAQGRQRRRSGDVVT